MARNRMTVVLGISVALLLSLPAISMAAAPFAAISDQGMFEHIYVGSGKPLVDTIQFVWIPETVPVNVNYELAGGCKHADLTLDEFSGKFKVIFKNITMVGLDSNNEVVCPKLVAKTRNGVVSKYGICDLGSFGAEFATFDSGVYVTARVQIKGRVRYGSYLQCFFGVNEYDATIFPNAAALLLRKDSAPEASANRVRAIRAESE